jgi:hypothetical protein
MDGIVMEFNQHYHKSNMSNFHRTLNSMDYCRNLPFNHGLVAQIFPLVQWINNPSDKFTFGFGFAIGRRF